MDRTFWSFAARLVVVHLFKGTLQHLNLISLGCIQSITMFPIIVCGNQPYDTDTEDQHGLRQIYGVLGMQVAQC